MNRTWQDEPRYVPVLVRADLRERAEREIERLEAEAEAAEIENTEERL